MCEFLNIESSSVCDASSLSAHDSICRSPTPRWCAILSLSSYCFLSMRVFIIVFRLLSILPFSLGTGDGAGPSRPAVAEDPVSIHAASLSSSIAQCESTVAAADRVLMDSFATGEARHAAERARNEANARLSALESQLQQITSSVGRHREPDSAT